jgi:adenylate kinase family enzyme
MARGILIVGQSGTGKSTSVSTLDPKETFIINVQGKDMPFKGYNKNYTKVNIASGPPVKDNMLVSDDAIVIKKVIEYIASNRPEIKSIIIDDWQYAAANEFMRKAEQKGFEKFTSIGKNIWMIAELPKQLTRDDLDIFYLTHSESAFDDSTGQKYAKAKTVGKLVDNVITLEGMFTIVIYTEIEKTKEGVKHWFVTQNDGSTTAKSPMGMFEEIKIPNDLKLVKEKLNEYYNG